MIVIEENQKTVSKDNPKEILNYSVKEIHLDESNKTIKVFIRDAQNYSRIIEALKHLYSLKKKISNFPEIPFNTKCVNSSKSFIFEKDIEGAIAFLLSVHSLSKITFEKILFFQNIKLTKISYCFKNYFLNFFID